MVKIFTFNPFQENTYLLSNDKNECIIIDPGCHNRQEEQELLDYIKEHKLEVKKLIYTHAHIDHVFGNDFVCNTFKLQPVMHTLEIPLFKSVPVYATNYGFKVDLVCNEIQEFSVAETILLGNLNLEIIDTPGHSPGSVSFYNREEGYVISGDALFHLSIGRTDLPGGNYDTLIASIKNNLMSLPNETEVYSGHGIPTTIGFEKENNPFLKQNANVYSN